mmetsp:Transcript_24059/g.57336  ORF Transcript_24059/g.57336 Transcript_24059/m.57336 type:complete len:269 (-) Transcript_24059:274-1080(-)
MIFIVKQWWHHAGAPRGAAGSNAGAASPISAINTDAPMLGTGCISPPASSPLALSPPPSSLAGFRGTSCPRLSRDRSMVRLFAAERRDVLDWGRLCALRDGACDELTDRAECERGESCLAVSITASTTSSGSQSARFLVVESISKRWRQCLATRSRWNSCNRFCRAASYRERVDGGRGRELSSSHESYSCPRTPNCSQRNSKTAWIGFDVKCSTLPRSDIMLRSSRTVALVITPPSTISLIFFRSSLCSSDELSATWCMSSEYHLRFW